MLVLLLHHAIKDPWFSCISAPPASVCWLSFLMFVTSWTAVGAPGIKPKFNSRKEEPPMPTTSFSEKEGLSGRIQLTSIGQKWDMGSVRDTREADPSNTWQKEADALPGLDMFSAWNKLGCSSKEKWVIYTSEHLWASLTLDGKQTRWASTCRWARAGRQENHTRRPADLLWLLLPRWLVSSPKSKTEMTRKRLTFYVNILIELGYDRIVFRKDCEPHWVNPRTCCDIFRSDHWKCRVF